MILSGGWDNKLKAWDLRLPAERRWGGGAVLGREAHGPGDTQLAACARPC
jgi:hypothetical protein